MKEIYIYLDYSSWLKDKPEIVIKGSINSRTDSFIEIYDENNFTQVINLQQVFAVVY